MRVKPETKVISEKAGPIDGRMLSITTMSPSRMDTTYSSADKPSLDASHIDDLRQAAAKMLGAQRRSFEAAMAVKYCRGSARQAEVMFGWSRQTIEPGLHERRSGVICMGAQEAFCGTMPSSPIAMKRTEKPGREAKPSD